MPTSTPTPPPNPKASPTPEPCSDCKWDTEVTYLCGNCRDKPGWQFQCEQFTEGGCFGCNSYYYNWCDPPECCEPFIFGNTLNCGWTVPDGTPYEEGFCACAWIIVGNGVEFLMCEGN
jgi:hypothetical protein